MNNDPRFSHELTDPLDPRPADYHPEDTGKARLAKLDGLSKHLGWGREGDFNCGIMFDRWRNHPCSDKTKGWMSEPPWGLGIEETERLDKLRSLNFGALWLASFRLQAQSKSMDSLQPACKQATQNIGAAWSGKAADAATGKVDDLGKGGHKQAVEAKQLAAHMFGAWQGATATIDKLANFESTIGNLLPNVPDIGVDDGGVGADYQEKMDMLSYALENGYTMYFKGAMWDSDDSSHYKDSKGSEQLPGGARNDAINVPYLRRTAGVDVSDEGGSSYYSNDVCAELDRFAGSYCAIVQNFRKRIREAETQINEHFRRLADGADQIQGQAFAGLQPGGDAATPTKQQPAQSTSPSGGAHATPHAAAPSQTSPASVQPYQPAPAHHAPVMPTPEPVSTTPAAATSTTAPASAAQLETITITEGNTRISVQSPDGYGHVRVTIDNGTGTPKSYNLDFDADKKGADNKGADNKSSQVAQERPAAADDRKVEIHDDAMTITAEQPDGDQDKLSITVDDGTNEPKTYTIDHAEGSQQLVTPQATAAPLGDAHDSTGAIGGDLPHTDADGSVIAAAGPGDATLAAAPDGAGQNGGQSGMMAGGMPMMGGGMGGSGSSGGDGERAGSGWRATGNLFEDEPQPTAIDQWFDADDENAQR